MGMYCTFRRVSMEKIEAYLNNSQLLEDDFYSNELAEVPKLDIDKAWDGIHFLLTGNPISKHEHPLSAVITGIHDIDENQDFGYGPARYIDSQAVKSLNEKIKFIDLEMLLLSFNPHKMAELNVYPEIWEDVHAFEYLREYFVKLQSFYQHAAWANEGIVIIIN